jgi:hypothetical protein
MMQVLAAILFAGAMAMAVGTIVAMVAPQWRRIVRLASGRPDEVFHPLAQLVQAERRIAVRRWASQGYRPAAGLREAA